ncbi:MAG: protein phosphatase 2C domain-containing protein [Desulfobacterales bacterium]|nr:protein phosphatase 2C domain-containing protein [Desulfobacterales bacterium]
MHKSEWCVIGESVRGASHIRNDLPNQDDIKWHPGFGSGLPVILAVSDGHGSQKCFRSNKGAGFAVETAVKTIKDFVESQTDMNNFTITKSIAEEQLPKQIVRKWIAAVKSDIEKNPFSDKESEILKGKDTLAYGATLLAVLVTSSFIIYLQLGDGDVLTVWENVERPVPEDDRLFGNETTSLCTKDAWRDFRFCFQVIVDSPPKLILLATDGYANSFKTDASFMKVGSDIWHIIESVGPDFVSSNLENWLNEASEAGSGDDITVGLIFQSVLKDTVEGEDHIPLWIACPV